MKKLSVLFTLLLCLLLVLTSCSTTNSVNLPLSVDLMADVHAAEKSAKPAEPDSSYVNSIGSIFLATISGIIPNRWQCSDFTDLSLPGSRHGS